MEIVYILINTRQGKLKIASNALKKYEEVDELHEVYGRFDIIVKIIAKDKAELKSFIQNKLQITEGIKSSETLIVNDLEQED
jgi:DNA-binding Lrp family transcriptional regulator